MGTGLFNLYINAPKYHLDPNLQGFGVARNQTSIYPSFFVVIVSVEPDQLFFQYGFYCDMKGTYNFLFIFPFRIKSNLLSTRGMDFNTTSYGSAVWIEYVVNSVGNYNVSGTFEIEDTFRTGTQGSYMFLLPFGRGILPEVVGDLQRRLGVTFFSPDTSRIDLSFVIPESYQIIQTIPPTKGAPSPIPSVYWRNMTGATWEFSQLQDSVAIYSQKVDEVKWYQVFLFFSGLLLSVGGEILITVAYDFLKVKANEVKTHNEAPPPRISEEFPIGRLNWHEWLDSIRTEYDVISRYRLEWAKTGHNYGWVVIPASLTLPTILFGYALQQPSNHIALLVGFFASWSLLLLWRLIHHQIDRQIRLLYPRAIEIEEILGVDTTRIWLRDQWKLDHLPSKKDALDRASKSFDFSRGHLLLDGYCVSYFIVTVAIASILWKMGWFF